MGLATMVSVSLIVVMVTEAFFVTGSDLHSGKVLELEFGVGKGRGRSRRSEGGKKKDATCRKRDESHGIDY